MLGGQAQLQALLKSMSDNAPKAAAYALTGLAFEVRKEVQKQVPTWVHLTRSFLPNQVLYEKATVDHLTARVGFSQKANFAVLLEQGGTRRPLSSQNIAVPVGAKTNSSGGISQANRPRALLDKPNYFLSRTMDSLTGLWQKMKRGATPLRLMYVFKKTTQYQKHFFHFFQTADSVLSAQLQAKFKDALAKLVAKQL